MRGKNSKINFWLILTSQIISFYFFMMVLPYKQRIFILIFTIFLTLVSFIYSLLPSFSILVSGILILSLYHTILVWGYGRLNQFEGILYSLVAIIFLSLTWLLAIYIKSYVEKNRELENRNKYLEKYHHELGVLTLNEFMERAELIFSILKRNRGSGVLIKASLKNFNMEEYQEKTSKGLIKTLSDAILKSIRKEFDIVGVCSSNTLIILLQNAKNPQIVVERIKKNLSKEKSINFENLVKDLSFEAKFFKEDFSSFKEYIENSCGKEEL